MVLRGNERVIREVRRGRCNMKRGQRDGRGGRGAVKEGIVLV